MDLLNIEFFPRYFSFSVKKIPPVVANVAKVLPNVIFKFPSDVISPSRILFLTFP